MDNEIWKQCGESKQKYYEISNYGSVKSISKVTKKEKILKQSLNKEGYLVVTINKKIKTHYLVAYTFIGSRPDGLQIDHIDRNKLNNRLDNLRYCTRCENMRNRDDFRDDISETDPKKRVKIRCAKNRAKVRDRSL